MSVFNPLPPSPAQEYSSTAQDTRTTLHPLSSEVGLVAFSTLILQLWQAEISIIPLGAIKLGPSFVQAQSHLFNSIKRKSYKGNNENF